MSLQVIGAGYGRTGTKSLQLALQQLGYNKCYHMEELIRNPEHVQHWNNAYAEKPVEWDQLFPGYLATVDFPGSMYYKELAKHYPEAKVVLTVRDPERWYNSAIKTIYTFDPGPALKLKLLAKLPFSSTARNFLKVIQFQQKSIWGKLFEGKFKDKDYAIANFLQHTENVKNNIPSERLLIYEVKEGWEPLCSFLEKPIPSTPFPNTNKGENFHEWATGVAREVIG